MKNPFEIIQYWLSKNGMTVDEKQRMKQAVLSYATTHPVKSGLLSPYAFRYATLALASLVLVLGGSVGITSASKMALPNQKLYPVKIWVEEFTARNQNTPENIIAFETKRIETRFNEATRLAVRQELNDSTSQIIQSGLEHSREAIRAVGEDIQAKNPELALAVTNNLETTFSSNAKILASIERNTNQNIGTIVLAAQVTTKKLAAEKIKFEHIVALKPNDDTKSQAVARLATLEKKLASLPKEDIAPAPIVSSDATVPAAADATTPAPDARLKFPQGTVLTVAEIVTPAPIETMPDAQTFADQAKKKMDAGLYSEALVIIQKAEQLLDEASLTKSLENTYQVKAELSAQ